jgi:hypothetical protein
MWVGVAAVLLAGACSGGSHLAALPPTTTTQLPMPPHPGGPRVEVVASTYMCENGRRIPLHLSMAESIAEQIRVARLPRGHSC